MNFANIYSMCRNRVQYCNSLIEVVTCRVLLLNCEKEKKNSQTKEKAQNLADDAETNP